MTKKQAVLDKLAEALTIALDQQISCKIDKDDAWVIVSYAKSGYKQLICVTMDGPVAMMVNVLDKIRCFEED